MDIRLKKEKDFNNVFKNGKRLYSKSLTLIYLESDSLKVGYAVGKKNGGSVQRNKLKRYLRESFRSFSFSIYQNFFFVFIPKDNIEFSLISIKKEMEYLLKKGNFI